jgi:hypothetical protein
LRHSAVNTPMRTKGAPTANELCFCLGKFHDDLFILQR